MIILKSVLEKKNNACGSDPLDEDWARWYSPNNHVMVRGIVQSV